MEEKLLSNGFKYFSKCENTFIKGDITIRVEYYVIPPYNLYYSIKTSKSHIDLSSEIFCEDFIIYYLKYLGEGNSICNEKTLQRKWLINKLLTE